MKYRKMGSLGWDVSALGFGCMRLPTSGFRNKVDEEYAIDIIRKGIDLGINYVDTAWPYHQGMSEVILGKALKDGYREKVHVATKLPMFAVNKQGDFDFYLNQQLERLQIDCIDVYLFHCLNKTNFEKVKQHNLIEKMEQAKAEGKIRYIGFSFHDIFPVLKDIVDYYSWDVGQIQYNYMDTDVQATTNGLKYLHQKGIAVVIMEPLKGGLLVNPPKEVQKILKNSSTQRTPVDWALQFLWDRPEVSVVLSGMGSMQQVVENCQSAERSGVGSFTVDDHKTVDEITKIFRKGNLVPCTGCGYCQPCPEGVSIPKIFAMVNNMQAGGDSVMDIMLRQQIKNGYKALAQSKEELKTGKDGSSVLCVQCGECVEKCPQSINVPEELKKVEEVISKQKVTPKQLLKMLLYAVKNWRLVLSWVRRGM
ncbi:MAG: aldo/keto reductase [Candidatus Bathyarchaeota archaeon]|nr:aldo/keto reductase [Candidatus Bathyarchaeota archaeon]